MVRACLEIEASLRRGLVSTLSVTAIARAPKFDAHATDKEKLAMSPDQIYAAMVVVKHSTLAAACIFAFKIAAFAVKMAF
ncbi:MAG: hypothetical protein N2444_09705 [Methylocystis sp.]|nr:hypothetical protein [Methylocystis sp.]